MKKYGLTEFNIEVFLLISPLAKQNINSLLELNTEPGLVSPHIDLS